MRVKQRSCVRIRHVGAALVVNNHQDVPGVCEELAGGGTPKDSVENSGLPGVAQVTKVTNVVRDGDIDCVRGGQPVVSGIGGSTGMKPRRQ